MRLQTQEHQGLPAAWKRFSINSLREEPTWVITWSQTSGLQNWVAMFLGSFVMAAPGTYLLYYSCLLQGLQPPLLESLGFQPFQVFREQSSQYCKAQSRGLSRTGLGATGPRPTHIHWSCLSRILGSISLVCSGPRRRREWHLGQIIVQL